MIEKQKKEIVEAEARALYAELSAKKGTEKKENGGSNVDEDLEHRKKIAGVIKGIIKTDNQEKERLAEKKVNALVTSRGKKIY